MKKFLDSDWLRAVQFLGKEKFSAKKGNSVQISLDLRLVYIYSMRMFL